MNAREIAEKLLRGFNASLHPGIYDHERSVVRLTAALEAYGRECREQALEDAADLFNQWTRHDQTYKGGVDDECALSFRVMDIISDNIRALKDLKP